MWSSIKKSVGAWGGKRLLRRVGLERIPRSRHLGRYLSIGSLLGLGAALFTARKSGAELRGDLRRRFSSKTAPSTP